jgi:hypothetical protein
MVSFDGSPTNTVPAAQPPTGTVILSVLDENGEPPTSATTHLGIELFRQDDPGATGEPPGQGLFCR